MTEEILLSAVLADPDDEAARLVLIDWWMERGDPRGECGWVQLRLKRGGLPRAEHAQLEERERQLLAEHSARWLSGYGLLAGEGTLQGGLLNGLSVTATRLQELSSTLPSRALVRTLRVWGTLADPAETLARVGHFPRLTSLWLDLERQARDWQGMFSAPALSRLTSLWVSGGEPLLAAGLAQAQPLSRLEILKLGGNALTDAGAEALAGSPHLGCLVELWLTSNLIEASGARALARSASFSRLRLLELGKNRIGSEGLLALAASGTLSRLTRLGLRFNDIGDAGVDALLASTRLAGLTHLELTENRISMRRRQALQARYGSAVFV